MIEYGFRVTRVYAFMNSLILQPSTRNGYVNHINMRQKSYVILFVHLLTVGEPEILSIQPLTKTVFYNQLRLRITLFAITVEPFTICVTSMKL